MRNVFVRHLSVLLLAGLWLFTVPGTAVAYDFSAVTKQISDNLDMYGGNVLVIIQQGDLEIFRFQAGTTQDDTKYGLASCSKWLSGAIILRMHENDLFRFEDQVGTHLPFFNNYSGQNGVTGSCTIGQCCSMKSGLYSTTTNPEINRFLTLEESVNRIASDIPLAFASGTKLAYAGCGLQTVGRICEVLDQNHRAWRTIAADELFTPLGMENCDYNYFGDKNPAIAGGAQGTAMAYLRFLHVLMNGGVTPGGQIYLRPRSLRRLLVNQTRDLPEHFSPFQDPSEIYPNNTKPDYGHASWIMVDDPNFPQSQVAIEVASPGAFGTWPWIDRQRNLRGIIYMFDFNGLTNTMLNNLTVIQAVRDAIDAVGEPAKPKAIIATSAVAGQAPLTVDFDASGSTDPEGDALTCVWDFGTTAVLGKQTSHAFTDAGSYEVILSVTDCKGTYATATVTLTVIAASGGGGRGDGCSPAAGLSSAVSTLGWLLLWAVILTAWVLGRRGKGA
ncbi:MAG: serine hydrolase [Planctomycetota bacterium]